MSNIVIAIDGPAGSGKSTVSKIIANKLGISVLDTGAMYRCVAYMAIRIGASTESHLSSLAESAKIEFLPGEPQRVLLDGEDVTEQIRSLHIGRRASEVSVFSSVRSAMVMRQRKLVASGDCVLEGRDVTTVVAPDATAKVFLTASIEERARRRWLQNKADSLKEVVKEVVERDHRDYTRKDSPLTLAEDAIVIESFGLTPEEVADKIIALIETK